MTKSNIELRNRLMGEIVLLIESTLWEKSGAENDDDYDDEENG